MIVRELNLSLPYLHINKRNMSIMVQRIEVEETDTEKYWKNEENNYNEYAKRTKPH